MLPVKTKLGAALMLALVLGAGLVAHQTLTAQSGVRGQRPADNLPLDDGHPGRDLRVQGGGAAPADLDGHLADVEKRLETALKEVRAARQALKAPQMHATPFLLKHADAARAAEVLKAAYPGGTMRITMDGSTNTLFVQAGPADIQAIRRLLEALDVKGETGADRGAGNNPNRP
jgi:hypothetical protein